MITKSVPRQSEKLKYGIPFRTNLSAGITEACKAKLQKCADSGNLNSPSCLQFRIGCCKP
jgi:hypothetical protein